MENRHNIITQIKLSSRQDIIGRVSKAFPADRTVVEPLEMSLIMSAASVKPGIYFAPLFLQSPEDSVSTIDLSSDMVIAWQEVGTDLKELYELSLKAQDGNKPKVKEIIRQASAFIKAGPDTMREFLTETGGSAN